MIPTFSFSFGERPSAAAALPATQNPTPASEDC
jgi:hypothetical protein